MEIKAGFFHGSCHDMLETETFSVFPRPKRRRFIQIQANTIIGLLLNCYWAVTRLNSYWTVTLLNCSLTELLLYLTKLFMSSKLRTSEFGSKVPLIIKFYDTYVLYSHKQLLWFITFRERTKVFKISSRNLWPHAMLLRQSLSKQH